MQNEKQDNKEKEETKDLQPEERKFDPAGCDHELCEMLGE